MWHENYSIVYKFTEQKAIVIKTNRYNVILFLK